MASRAGVLFFVTVGAFAPGSAFAQWNPSAGQWHKTDTNDLRVMTWNVQDGICSSNDKVEDRNNWCALARIVAAMQPDVLILQETADNSGNGTGGGVDSVATLTTTINLFLHGGNDPFHGNTLITAWVQKYAPSYDLPFIFVSAETDAFNRNVILSRYPFVDLTGDGKSQISDTPNVVTPAGYAAGGDGGIRGFMFAEINLPDATYLGNLVLGCAHLKSGGAASDLAERLAASKNVAYVIDFWFNGAGTATPDPNGRISDSPPATMVLDANTPVVIGGDWNEDELNNGRKGPAEWLTRAEFTGGTDGTDKDRTDATFDSATNPFNGSRNTQGSSKLDYVAWQDSVATLRAGHAVVFNTAGLPLAWFPPEVAGYPGLGGPGSASGDASDHRPVILDLMLPLVPEPAVILSEIMYNPASDESGPNDVEWVEIYNPGILAQDIGGWYLQDEDGATGVLPPGTMIDAGQAVVFIPSDQSVVDFQAAWGNTFDVYPLTGWNTSMAGLSNDPTSVNEVLTLRDDLNQVVDTVNFEDLAPWPTDVPDGPSIFLIPGALDSTANDSGSNWSRSADQFLGAYVCIPTVDFDGADVGSPGFVETVAPECFVDGDCDDGFACTDDSCVVGVCMNVPDDVACDNVVFCDGAEVCNVLTGCQPGANPCPGQQCDEAGDQCVECLVAAQCVDGNACTDDDCIGFVCSNSFNTTPCDDNEYCTINDACSEGFCTGDPNTRLYADIVPPPDGSGVVDVDDLLCLLVAFVDLADCPEADIAPCNGDGFVDVDDLISMLEAIAGNSICTCG
ncbi:MAG: lamin tail domain-containing protein [Planctomycetota bacterium]